MQNSVSHKWGGMPKEPFHPCVVIEPEDSFDMHALSHIARIRIDSDRKEILFVEAVLFGDSNITTFNFRAKSGRAEDIEDLMARRLFFANAIHNQDKAWLLNSDNWPKSSDIPLLQAMLTESQALIYKGAPAPAKRQISVP